MPKVDTQNILGALQQGSEEMASRATTSRQPPRAHASAGKPGRPPRAVEKVQMTCRISRELQRRLDQEIARVRAEGATARSEATLGPVVEALLWRALGRKA